MSTLIGSIIVFMLVITLHELGHFTVAKLSGIKVNEFAIGMGPKLFSKNVGETKYSLRALPIGGYVAMEGEEEYSHDPRAFNNVNVFKRMAVVLAGVFMNFVLAVAAFFIVFLFIGVQTNILSGVMEGSPAELAGLQKGDRIVAIQDQKINEWRDVINTISTSTGEIKVKVERNNEQLTFYVVPYEKDGRQVIGITPEIQKSATNALSMAFKQTISTIKDVFSTIGMLFNGKANVSMLAGPVGVISIIGQETSKGILNLIGILGLISANLAVVNLLPIPALDGGKFVFLIIESITGKPVNEKIENNLTLVGFSLLIGLMLYITIFGDLNRIING